MLERIKSPADVKGLGAAELRQLADETRAAVINKVSKAGGHIGPNLGMVEMTVALHYVFDSPRDKFVFDVSHQCYPHKILTGRAEAFTDDSRLRDVTGYTNPRESEHDIFTVGHTSTSVSLALGLAKARDLKGTDENIIAIIGDGSLSGGEALEALDYAGEYGGNLIIIVNDNDMSIAENHGGLYRSLRSLRESDGAAGNNPFTSLGLDYRYLGDGHDIQKLTRLFESVKGIRKPVVLHIRTIKGKGLPYAEKDREAWHAGGPFNVADGSRPGEKPGDTTVFDSLRELLDTNERAVVLNAATPMCLGFTGKVREEYAMRGQFVDVGIAEESAVAMAAGVAANGGVPVFGTFAPFFQRVYDQMSHDVALNSAPATFLIMYPGVHGMNSNTHTALCDIQMFAHIPNLLYLAPATKEEYERMFRYATSQRRGPVGIRVLRKFEPSGEPDTTDYSSPRNKVVLRGKDVAILAVGPTLRIAREAAGIVRERTGKEITVVNPLLVSALDTGLLEELKEDHRLIITTEDGLLQGGYGQTVASFYGDSDMRVVCHGISKEFHTDFDAAELLARHGISAEKLADETVRFLTED